MLFAELAFAEGNPAALEDLHSVEKSGAVHPLMCNQLGGAYLQFERWDDAERLGKIREAITAYETALGIGYQPNQLHRRLAELYRPLDAEKAAFHKKTYLNSRKRRVYKADIKSKLPSAGAESMGSK